MSFYMKEPQGKAQACIMWMHGLGADSSDMASLVEQLSLQELAIRHVFVDAPKRPVTLNGGMVMPAWYDIFGMDLADREDKTGVEQSESYIRQVMGIQIKEGLHAQQIFLAGFSQGGAMALHTALHTEARLGGVIALSAYLPLANHSKPQLDKKTPFFMGCGQFDPIVLPKWSQMSRECLLAEGYKDIAYHLYPMEHSICFEEIEELSFWIIKQVQGVI